MKFFGLLPVLVFLTALVALAFSAGMTLAVLQWPPYPLFVKAHEVARELVRGPWLRNPSVVPRLHDGEGVVVHDPGRVQPGLTAVQGMFEDGAAIRIYATDGTLVHEWPVAFFDLWPEPDHIVPARNVPNSRFGYHLQGMVVESDGSVVLNVAEKGTAKLSPCGEVLWTVDRMTHHSITRTEDGSYWIPVKRDPQDIADAYLLPGTTRERLLRSDNYYADSALLVAPDGTVEAEVPLLEPVIDWLGEQGAFHRFYDLPQEDLDPLHVNDVEVVTPALAARIPGADPGDLLLSLRNLHALAILDPEAGAVRWMQSGPWIRQHDPDITGDGLVEVYDNGVGYPLPGRDFAGSRILRHDPASGRTETLYPVSAEAPFFSWIMGTHQLLPNGNRLIAETARGRVFEVTEEGEIVWSLVLAATEDAAALVEEAARLPEDHVDPAVWDCPEAGDR